MWLLLYSENTGKVRNSRQTEKVRNSGRRPRGRQSPSKLELVSIDNYRTFCTSRDLRLYLHILANRPHLHFLICEVFNVRFNVKLLSEVGFTNSFNSIQLSWTPLCNFIPDNKLVLSYSLSSCLLIIDGIFASHTARPRNPSMSHLLWKTIARIYLRKCLF